MNSTIRVGTRGSKLALVQADLVIEAMARANPGVEFSREIIRTTGDIDKSVDISRVGYGVFVSELESALRDGRVDVAVHSLKDMPSSLPGDLVIAAVPPREDPRDALVTGSGVGLAELSVGATVGTGSARRKALLLERRPDLRITQLRGNVPTRLSRLDEPGGPAAIVLAAAGLKRLGLETRISEYLACWDFVSAVGQGALAVETLTGNHLARNVAQSIDDADTRIAVEAERRFLAEVEGGCSAPVSAHARIRSGRFTIHAFAGSPDGKRVIRGEREGNPGESQRMASELAQELLANGATDLVAGQTGAES